MSSRLVTLSPIAALAVVAAAQNPHKSRSGSTCSTGTVSCCNQKFDGTTLFHGDDWPNGPVAVITDAIPNAGLECTPIAVLGMVGASSCVSQAARCDKVKQGGLANVACTPDPAPA